MKVIVAWMLVMMGAYAQNTQERASHISMEKPRVLCGPVLAEARALFCLAEDETLQKRSIRPRVLASLLPRDVQENLVVPYVAQRSRVLAIGRGKREQGLVDECCYKPCYISEILNYC